MPDHIMDLIDIQDKACVVSQFLEAAFNASNHMTKNGRNPVAAVLNVVSDLMKQIEEDLEAYKSKEIADA